MQHFGWQFEFQASPVLGPAAAAAEELDQSINVIKAAVATAC
jgi:hypothetical protein